MALASHRDAKLNRPPFPDPELGCSWWRLAREVASPLPSLQRRAKLCARMALTERCPPPHGVRFVQFGAN